MKNGAPTSAVMMPTSTSDGRATTRPTTSAAVSRIAPTRVEKGSSQRWSIPTSSRQTCGTTSPTKPIGPATAVAAPQSNTAPAAAISRVVATRSPSPAATSSPSASEFSPRAEAKQITAPTSRNGSTRLIEANVPPPTPPICQKRNSFITSIRGSRMALTNELNAAAVAAPASASLSGVAPPRPREPTEYTKTADTAAPAMATKM